MGSKKQRFAKDLQIKNRRARYEYELQDKYVAGIVLQGTEIKSIREGKVNLKDAYCYFHDDELFVKQMHISPYQEGSFRNHDPDRVRKLLLNRNELRKIQQKSNDTGITIIPTRLFINSRGLAKLEIALGRGKKLHDKRESIRERDIKRELERHKF